MKILALKTFTLGASLLALSASADNAVASCPTAAAGKYADSASSSLLAPGADIGMWVWREEQVTNPQERQALIAFCQKFGITRIFVQVRFDKDGQGYRLSTPEAWSALLSAAHKAGVKVEALDGAGEMGFAENLDDTLARLDALLAFQLKQPADARFSGVHYDIEPYVTTRWKQGDKTQVLLELLDTMTEIRASVQAADPSMTIAHDIPFWYSGRSEFLIEYNGTTKGVDEHIQDMSDFMGIMSYRTHMTGHNSTSDIGKEELDYAGRTDKKVYLSIETVPLDETPQITFHDRDPVLLVEAIRELNAHQQGTPGYGGIFLHCYRTARPMLEQWDASHTE